MSQNPSVNHRLRALVLDMDGVLWRGDEPIGDLPAIFDTIRRSGWEVLMATNNSTRTPEQYQAKLAGLGVQIDPRQVITSSLATAHYLKGQFPQGGPLHIIGEDGLVQALREEGFYQQIDGALAVVAGMDRALTYDKLRAGCLLIRSGRPFIGTNPDVTFPTPVGLVPGTGAILAALQVSTGVEPLLMGKPYPGMYRFALERLNLPPSEVLAVGDRLETDIAGAQQLGCPSALVLSGVTTPEQARRWRPQPEYIAADLADLLRQLE